MNRCSKSSIEEMETKRDIKYLINALKGEDMHVRYRAGETLGEIGDSRVADSLIHAPKT